MFHNLQTKLNQAFRILKGRNKITEINIIETLKEIRRALIDADVSYKIAKNFTNTVKEKAIGQKVITSINPNQLMIKIVHDELSILMGEDHVNINLSEDPTIILNIGLQGSGKTTFSVKLANFLKKKQKSPLLVTADVYRPAAIEQLNILAKQINIPVFKLDGYENNPIDIIKKSINYAKIQKNNIIIIDTAGRLAIDEIMMNELQIIYTTINPTETLFVVDSMTGQDAINITQTFHDKINFNGVVLTKLDGDTRGGVALTIRSLIKKPIKFISTGEKIENIDIFYPKRMADRILGMGDVVSLVERMQEQFNEKETRKFSKKISKNQFGFDLFLTQIQKIKNIGNLKDIINMIPGVNKTITNFNFQNNILKETEAIIYSMTPYERKNPKKINISCKKRISNGSGVSIEKVNYILKNFLKINETMKYIQNSNKQKIIKKMFK